MKWMRGLMTDFFMKMNLIQYAALAGAVVLLLPVLSDLSKTVFSFAGKVRIPVIASKKKRHDANICFEHVMCVRSLLAKSGDEDALSSYDDLIIPNLVRVLSESE